MVENVELLFTFYGICVLVSVAFYLFFISGDLFNDFLFSFMFFASFFIRYFQKEQIDIFVKSLVLTLNNQFPTFVAFKILHFTCEYLVLLIVPV